MRSMTRWRGIAQFDEGCPPHLAEAIRYSLLAPGKRLSNTMLRSNKT